MPFLLTATPTGDVGVLFNGSYRNLGPINSYEGTTPEEKIAHAFLHLGIDLVKHLRGDFSLYLISDSFSYLARDRFGIVPVFYTFEEEVLRYGEAIADVYTGQAVDEHAVYAYLNCYSDTEPTANAATFFKGICSLPQGCYLYWKKGQDPVVKAYWKPEPENSLGRNQEALFQDFKDRIFTSVRQRVEPYTHVAAHLSGGLDSSVMAIALAELGYRNFPTLYFDIQDPKQVDPFYANIVSEKIGSRHFHLNPSDLDIYTSVAQVSKATGYPEQFILPSNVQMVLAQKAKALGSEAILTGIDGDSIVGHGWAYMEKLKKDQDWEAFFALMEKMRRGRLGARGMHEILEKESAQAIKKNSGLWKLLSVGRKHYGYYSHHFIQFLMRSVWQRMLSPRVAVAENYFLRAAYSEWVAEKTKSIEDLYDHSDEEIVQNFKAAINAGYPKQFLQFDAIGKIYDQKFLFPFFDQSLFELCLGIPDSMRFGEGHTRWLMREAMRSRMPKSLYLRQGKDDFSLYLKRSCLELWQKNADRFMGNEQLWQIIHQDRFIKKMKQICAPNFNFQGPLLHYRKLNRILYLGIWLETLELDRAKVSQ